MPWRVMRNKAEIRTGIKTSMRLGAGVAHIRADWDDPEVGDYRPTYSGVILQPPLNTRETDYYASYPNCP